MTVVSVNVSLAREFVYKDRVFATGIFKEPVLGKVRVRLMNLDGDQQADLSVHGGPDKAVYAYPSEHYVFWRDIYPSLELPWGMLGENVTTEGLREDEVNIGDHFRFGSSILMVTQPRLPCQKLAAKFNDPVVGKHMMAGRRTGFYLSVVQEGEVASGDPIEVLHRDKNNLKVSDIVLLQTSEKGNRSLIDRALETKALPEVWRTHLAQKLARLESRL